MCLAGPGLTFLEYSSEVNHKRIEARPIPTRMVAAIATAGVSNGLEISNECYQGFLLSISIVVVNLQVFYRWLFYNRARFLVSGVTNNQEAMP